MSELRRPLLAAWSPLIGSLVVVLFLATLSSFAATFGVMTNCTDTYSCTITSCGPCSAASTWLNVGWARGCCCLSAGPWLSSSAAGSTHMGSG